MSWPSIAHLVAAGAERFGDTPAIVEPERTLSFRELSAEVDRCAAALITNGIEVGDRVSIWAPNISEFVIAAFGIHTAGGVLVPINTRFKGTEAADILTRSGATLLFAVNDFLGMDHLGMLADVGATPPERVVLLRGSPRAGATLFDDFLAEGDGVPPATVAARRDAVGAEHLSDIMFTSGTTGRPKGVMMNHGQSLRNFQDWCDISDLREGDPYLVVNPFFHMFGYKAGFLAAQLQGATVYPVAVFDAGEALRTIEEKRIRFLPGPPTLFQSLLDHPDRHTRDISSLRGATTGAADIPTELIRRMREELGFESVVTSYGLTEGLCVTTTRGTDDDETIATSVGRAYPDIEVRLFDTDDKPVATGEIGEVRARGYHVMQGYLDDPKATAETVIDGWLHTGDLGTFDEAGNLRIVGRIKDLFIVGGFNAYPAEIENLLLGHPEVQRVAVIGVPDERMGEVGMAWIVAEPGTQPSEEAIIAWSREHMANYKAPRFVRFLDEIPLNATGKVDKLVLKEMAAR